MSRPTNATVRAAKRDYFVLGLVAGVLASLAAAVLGQVLS